MRNLYTDSAPSRSHETTLHGRCPVLHFYVLAGWGGTTAAPGAQIHDGVAGKAEEYCPHHLVEIGTMTLFITVVIFMFGIFTTLTL